MDEVKLSPIQPAKPPVSVPVEPLPVATGIPRKPTQEEFDDDEKDFMAQQIVNDLPSYHEYMIERYGNRLNSDE